MWILKGNILGLLIGFWINWNQKHDFFFSPLISEKCFYVREKIVRSRIVFM